MFNRVLLLNANHMPIDIISPKKAVGMLMAGRAMEAPGPNDIAAILKTPNDEFLVPAILRAKFYKGVPQLQTTWSRENIFKRDSYTCIWCGRRPGDWQDDRVLTTRDFTIEHIKPRSKGGKSTWTNTACACHKCNNRKGDMTESDMRANGTPPRWSPGRPKVSYLVIGNEDIPNSWKIYIEFD